MADKKISDFTAAGSLAAGDLFEIENGAGNSRKVTAALIGAGLGVLHAYDEQASGTAGGSSVAAWTPRILNTTKLNTISGASLSTSVVTITIASPGVVTWNSHGFAAGVAINIATTGALPTGLTAGVTYYVVSPAANTFQLAATPGGAAINTSGSQSGTHTASSSEFTLPAGTFDIQANAPCYSAGTNTGFKARLYNVTGAATLIDGTSIWGGVNAEQQCLVKGRFTLSGTSVVRLEMIATAVRATNGFGVNAGITSVNNHFADMAIRQVS